MRKYIGIAKKFKLTVKMFEYLEIIAIESFEKRISEFQKYLGLVDEPVLVPKFPQKLKDKISKTALIAARKNELKEIIMPMLFEILSALERLILVVLLYLVQHLHLLDMYELVEEATRLVEKNEDYDMQSREFHYNLEQLAKDIETRIETAQVRQFYTLQLNGTLKKKLQMDILSGVIFVADYN